MSGPWAVWDDCLADGMCIDANAFPTYWEAYREAQRWLDEVEEHHLFPGRAKLEVRAMCEGGPSGDCEGYCPKTEADRDDYDGAEVHAVERLVWAFTMRERKGMDCGDPRR